MTKIYVIGIGYKPFDKRQREIIYNSEFILSSSRLFEVFKGYEEFEKVKERVLVIDNVDETINFIKSQIRTQGGLCPPCEIPLEEKGPMGETMFPPCGITVLASGDPLFFGIGRRVISEFRKDMMEIIPDLSSIQVAFSRIKEPWDNAFLMSLHKGPDPKKRRGLEYKIKDIPILLERHKKIAILTDRENNPTEIAKILTSSPITRNLSLIMFVCERLGYLDEKITKGPPEDITDMSFSDPNVVIILLGGLEER
ncbi:MAG: precorrin-6y C5,15-methyltransferase (decarboxylating) subunit CbiE [Thermodesulfovibrionales bacterium]|nr:precorrin-6y C5,15-methyltransferase (decarboxylating) subunit CbiE [Thermodesulfovibrionales bacterium]